MGCHTVLPVQVGVRIPGGGIPESQVQFSQNMLHLCYSNSEEIKHPKYEGGMPDQNFNFKQSCEIKVWLRTFPKQLFCYCNVNTKVIGIWNWKIDISLRTPQNKAPLHHGKF